MAKDIYVPARIIGGKIPVKASLGQTVIKTVGPDEYTGPVTVTPSESEQTLRTADKLVKSDIFVNPIPSEYIVPTGSMEITENGQYDITEKASVSVDVPIPPQRVVTGTFVGNGTTEITIPAPFDPDIIIAYSPNKLADYAVNATWYFFLGPMVSMSARRTTSGWGDSASVINLPSSNNRPGKTYVDGALTLRANGSSIYQFANGATYNYILIKLSQ